MILVARYIETHATYTHIMLSITITKGVHKLCETALHEQNAKEFC